MGIGVFIGNFGVAIAVSAECVTGYASAKIVRSCSRHWHSQWHAREGKVSAPIKARLAEIGGLFHRVAGAPRNDVNSRTRWQFRRGRAELLDRR